MRREYTVEKVEKTPVPSHTHSRYVYLHVFRRKPENPVETQWKTHGEHVNLHTDRTPSSGSNQRPRDNPSFTLSFFIIADTFIPNEEIQAKRYTEQKTVKVVLAYKTFS